MPRRPTNSRPRPDLEARIRAACCPFHGLTHDQHEQHVQGIKRMVEHALAGKRLPRKRAA